MSKTPGLHDDTNYLRLIKSLDFTEEIEEEQRKALEEVARKAVSQSPKESGKFAAGFRKPETVTVKKEGKEVVAILENDVPYGGFLREGSAYFADVRVYDPAEKSVMEATKEAIATVIRRKV